MEIDLDNPHAGALAFPTCRRLHYAREEADVRRELVPGGSFEEWLRCGRCGTSSAEFRPATKHDGGLRRGNCLMISECVVQRCE